MERPKLIIIAGPNGSGKTSVTGRLLKHTWIENCKYINPDIIARDEFGDWNLPESVLKAAQYATEVRENCLASRQSLIFETVLSSTEKLDFIRRAKQSNYFVRLFFIGTDHPSINAQRITLRVIKGGHDVPISKIISRYYKSIINCSDIAPDVDRLYVYDNSIENAFPSLLFRARDGLLMKQYAPLHDWSSVIFDRLNSSPVNF